MLCNVQFKENQVTQLDDFKGNLVLRKLILCSSKFFQVQPRGREELLGNLVYSA